MLKRSQTDTGHAKVTSASAMARTLLDSRSGILGQGVRFATAGGAVSLVYLGTTLVLADVIGVAFQVALASGFCVALLVHFTLQRVFVWVNDGDFALRLHQQVGRYLLVAGAQYGLTVASTSLLPPLLNVPTEVVYVVTALVLISTNFLVFRHGVFHARAPADDERTSDASEVPEAPRR